MRYPTITNISTKLINNIGFSIAVLYPNKSATIGTIDNGTISIKVNLKPLNNTHKIIFNDSLTFIQNCLNYQGSTVSS